MMENVREYYIVKKEIFEKCMVAEHSLEEQIDRLPKKIKGKISNFLQFLKAKGINWGTQGNVCGFSNSILELATFATRGKKKPSDWEKFLPLLIDAPAALLSEKAKKDIKRIKRKHGRQIHKESVD